MSIPADSSRLNDFTQSIKFQAYLHALLKRLWVIVLVVIVAGFVGAAHVFRTPVTYRSDVVLQVEQEEQKPINIDEVARENLQSLEILKTIEQNFRTRSLMLRVIEANKLTSVPGFLPTSAGRANEEELVGFLLDRSTARLRHGTRLIDVSFEHEDKKWARTIADSLVKQQVLQNLAQRYSASETASDFLLSEADRLRKKLERSEQSLQDYKEKTASVSLEERQNIVVDKLKELNAKVTAAKGERLKLEADLAQIRQAGQNVEALLTIPSVGAQSSVADLRQKLVTQEADIATLAQRYKDKHPKMMQAKSQLEEIKRSLNEAVRKSPALVQSAFDAASGNEKNLETALADQEKSALALSQQSIQYNVLLRDVDSDKTLYEAVLRKVKETKIALGMESHIIRIVEPAVPAYPVQAHKIKTMALSLGGGLFLSCLLVLGLNALDSSIKTVDEAERILNMPVLGTIPAIRNTHGLLLFERLTADVAEDFRSLRASISLLGPEEERSSFLFTSAVPSEGKTFTSANFATSLAQQGLRTLIIDGDLRMPAMEKFLLGTSDLPGVTDYLVSKQSLDELVKPTAIENLCLLPAGTRAPNPAELLSREWFGELIKDALKSYDRVVVDTAPINAVSDTLTIVQHVQTVCLIIRAQKTPRRAVQRAVALLNRAGKTPSGIILNRTPAATGLGYYYHYSSKAYTKGQVYGPANSPA